jgi:hypothetical protein
MPLDKPLALITELPIPADLTEFRARIDASWIEQALAATDTATIRRRRLPADQVIWLVIGMALFRNRSISNVVDTLDLALPVAHGRTAAPSAITQARDRVGAEPMQWLFGRCAEQWGHGSAAQHRWRDLALYGVDGTTLRVADSDENRDHFGSANTGARGLSGYPLLRLVALMSLRSHQLAATAFGPYTTGECTYARQLWSAVPQKALCVVDRGFFAADVLIPLARDKQQRHWLTRAKKNQKWRVLAQNGPDDFSVEMDVTASARKNDPSLPKTWQLRAIRYQRTGFQPQWLLTSLCDSKQYPAPEIVALYHERWEIELGYDEIKTEMLDREEALRSRSPERVEQELWGVLIAYNLVRLEMERVADQAKVEPTRISFVAAMRFICDEWLWCSFASPGAIPKHLLALRANLRRFILPERRSERSYPRAVKIKMSNYDRKRRSRPPAAKQGRAGGERLK